MINIFIASDVHGKFDELWNFLINQGFVPGNKNFLLILNGDIIHDKDNILRIEKQIKNIENKINKYKNILYLKGNHEASVEFKYKKLKNFISKLPIAFINNNIFVCHGWFNPKWNVSEHKNKRLLDYNFSHYGDIYHGSPQNIILREKLFTDYFGYKNINEYELALKLHYPNHIFIFGHYHNFLWSYEECKSLNYFMFIEEANKLMESKDNLISKMCDNFDYSKPYISPLGNIRCIDVFTKCHLLNLKYYFYVDKFISENNFKIAYEDGEWLEFNI